jgi:hypothetical protein
MRSANAATSEAARRLWNRRFDGQYGISARELEADVVTVIRQWFEHWSQVPPPCLEHPERHTLAQVVTGCLSSFMTTSENVKLPEHPTPPCCSALPSRAIQIQSVQHPGDSNCGPHSMLFALLESGAIYVQYFSSGYSNVPTVGKWYQIEGAAEHGHDTRS